MPVLMRDDAEIYFEEFGSGYPVLLFAPGGLRSRIEMWHAPAEGPARPWNDWTEELASRYRVIAMDQRNAGRSRGAIAADHGWHTYAADHLALMDHLGFKRFHTLGGCIGSSYCLKLCEVAPARVSAAVLQNPIGLHPEFPDYFPGKSCRMVEGATRGAARACRGSGAKLRAKYVGQGIRLQRDAGVCSAVCRAVLGAPR
jgi:pimeloyl-ACP methyl ester carboxylesterase